ncbi:hypothetical protein A8630_002411 [Escherichia coli]|nr:hypothetical protein [Escherichia coli]EKG8104708.1 hypothetical protein [Escherichia coli]
MKKIYCVILSILFLSGCADPSIQKQRDVLIARAPSDFTVRGSNIPVRISDIRGQLVSNGWETDDFVKRLTDKCYHLSYAKSGGCALDYYYSELLKRTGERNDAICNKDEKCIKEKNIIKTANELNTTYYFVMARNPYDQSELDFNIRALCKAAGIGQRRGISIEQIREDVEQQPGLSPEIRGQFRDIAVACWKLSEYGINDGAKEIKNIY